MARHVWVHQVVYMIATEPGHTYRKGCTTGRQSPHNPTTTWASHFNGHTNTHPGRGAHGVSLTPTTPTAPWAPHESWCRPSSCHSGSPATSRRGAGSKHAKPLHMRSLPCIMALRVKLKRAECYESWASVCMPYARLSRPTACLARPTHACTREAAFSLPSCPPYGLLVHSRAGKLPLPPSLLRPATHTHMPPNRRQTVAANPCHAHAQATTRSPRPRSATPSPSLLPVPRLAAFMGEFAARAHAALYQAMTPMQCGASLLAGDGRDGAALLEADGAVEHQAALRAGRRVGVAAKVAQPLKLEAVAGLQVQHGGARQRACACACTM